MTDSQDARRLLAELIDAHAAAKASGNETLIRMSVGPLNEFITSYDFIPVSSSEVTTQDNG